ncbi:MAG: PDZ domain-containing protein [Planctomycetales bacterium]
MRASSCIPRLVLSLASGLGPLAARADAPVALESAVATWIVRLDHSDYETRLDATENLIGAGGPAVAPLVAAAGTGSPEAVARAIAVLEAIYRGDDPEASSAAEDALDKLAASRNGPTAGRASEAIAANFETRRERAIEQIKRLGGIVEPFPVPERAGIVSFPPEVRSISHIVLGRSWKGGDEGIKYIKRLPDLPALYVTKGPGFSPISPQAEQELLQAIPHLRLQVRGLAFLGIQGEQNHQGGCLVNGVTPGAAAEKAGIEPGDMVLKFDGKPVADFQSLIDLIMEKQPGQTAPAIIRRAGREIELTIELGTWADVKPSRNVRPAEHREEPFPAQDEPEPIEDAVP